MFKQPPLIVHIIYELGTGGLENGLINIINRSPPHRYRHAIVCLTSKGEFASRLDSSEVEIVELHKRQGHDLAVYWRLWRTLRRLRPAIIHTRNLAALETQVLGLIMPGIKRIHGEHGRDVHDLDGTRRSYHLLRMALSPLIHRFITVSRDLGNWLVETVGIPAEKVTQIYNGVDGDRFSAARTPGIPAAYPQAFQMDGCRVIGTVGRLALVKDQALLIRAVAHIFSVNPPLRASLRCIIVGDGPERANLVSCIADYGLEANIWLAGDRQDIPELLSLMEVFVLPSLGEGVSNTILEAMASGLPVIATDTGGNPELVEDGRTGVLVPVGNVERLAVAIMELLEDPALCESMRSRARGRIDAQFNWDRTVEEYMTVYDQVLAGPATQTSTGGS